MTTDTDRLLSLAREFHDTYERLAPSFGYETRKDTRVFDPASPNGKLMLAVCAEVEQRIRQDERELAARVCEKFAAGYDPSWAADMQRLALHCAAAIRSSTNGR